MKILRIIQTAYGATLFGILCILLFPFLLIPILFPRQFRLVGIINRWWARLLFLLQGLPFSVEYRCKLDPSKQYIFCPNHFSYLDIPTMGLNTHNTIFVGKNELGSIPLFGFMYSRLHITVDRAKLKSRYTSMIKTLEALDEGKSLVIFPEGGIVAKTQPGRYPEAVMGSFKDGAFRASIEKQIPIVPVTIPYNWILLPVDQFVLHRGKTIKVIFHEPIDPAPYSMERIEALKERVREVIETELERYIPYENQSRTIG